jgi:hypothetical protein
MGLPVPRIALASIGIPPSVPPGPPGTTAGVAPALVTGNAEATWLNAGAAEAQPCGTESMPTEAARPTPAVTALPIPGAPKTPVPEPKPLPTADPNAWNWLPKMLAAGPTDRMSAPGEPIIEMPDVDIDAPEPVPDTRLVPDVSAVDDDVRVVNNDVDEVDDIDEAVEARPALGTAAPNGVDIAVVRGATV